MSSPELPARPELATPDQAIELADLIFESHTRLDHITTNEVNLDHAHPLTTVVVHCPPSPILAEELGLHVETPLFLTLSSIVSPSGMIVTNGPQHYLTISGDELGKKDATKSSMSIALIGDKRNDSPEWSYQRIITVSDHSIPSPRTSRDDMEPSIPQQPNYGLAEAIPTEPVMTRTLANEVLNWLDVVIILNERD